jgi:hypothetical protein
MQQYEQTLQQRRNTSRSNEATFRSQQRAAQTNADDAEAKHAAACVLGRQAVQARDGAARTATRELDDAGRTVVRDRNVFQRAWDRVDDFARDLTANPKFTSWLNILSDVGDVLTGIGTVMAFVPFLQPFSAAVLALGVGFKGAAFVGTLLAYRYGNATTSQVFGSGLDVVLSAVPTGAVGKVSKKVGTPLASRLPKLTRTITRKLPVQRLVAGGPGPLDDVVAKSLPIKPKTYFDLVDRIDSGSEIGAGLMKAGTGGFNLSADISKYQDPRDLDSMGDVAPEAIAPVVQGAGRLAGVTKVGDALSEVVDLEVEAGELRETWAEEINR